MSKFPLYSLVAEPLLRGEKLEMALQNLADEVCFQAELTHCTDRIHTALRDPPSHDVLIAKVNQLACQWHPKAFYKASMLCL